jgi:hypothetical protein
MQLLRPSTHPASSDAHEVVVTLTAPERRLVLAALSLVRSAIAREEFQTRLGAHPWEADALLDALVRPDRGPTGGLSQGTHVGDAPRQAESGTTLSLPRRQLGLINNALNEGLHGFGSEEVPPALKGRQARSLLKTVGSILDKVSGDPPSRMGSGSEYFDHLR